MVFANAVCAMNLAATMIVNGVCCFYQMNEDNERRKEQQAAIEKAIRDELSIFQGPERKVERNESIQAHHIGASFMFHDNETSSLPIAKIPTHAAKYDLHGAFGNKPMNRDQIELIERNTARETTLEENRWKTQYRSPSTNFHRYGMGRITSKRSELRRISQSLIDASLDDDEYDDDFEEICLE